MVFDVIDLNSEAAVDALGAARDGRARIRGPVVATAKGFHYFVLSTGLPLGRWQTVGRMFSSF
jgi:hypothetical protein